VAIVGSGHPDLDKHARDVEPPRIACGIPGWESRTKSPSRQSTNCEHATERFPVHRLNGVGRRPSHRILVPRLSRATTFECHSGVFSGGSFPCGHAAAAAASFAAFALLAGIGRSPRAQAGLAAAGALAIGIACTRVFLDVHWLTGVIAGLALGWAWFAPLLDRLRRAAAALRGAGGAGPAGNCDRALPAAARRALAGAALGRLRPLARRPAGRHPQVSFFSEVVMVVPPLDIVEVAEVCPAGTFTSTGHFWKIGRISLMIP